MASSIFASGLSVSWMSNMQNMDEVDEAINDAFEEERVDRFIRVYDSNNMKLLYANEFGQVASLPVPSGNKFSTEEYGDRRFRILEVKKGPIILQVALIIDSVLSKAKELEKNAIVFSVGLLLIILTITALSLRALLKPLKVLGQDFAQWSDRLSFDFSPMKGATDQLLIRIQGRQKEWRSGEVSEFLKQIYAFAFNLSNFLQFSQKQYSVLAHELKTPLTIIRNKLDNLKSQPALGAEVSEVIKEVDELSKLIRDFLDWSQQAASTSKPEELFAIKLGPVAEDEVKKLNRLYDRIIFDYKSEAEVYCAPAHIRQVIVNLIQNAILHGPENKSVFVRVESSFLEVEDQGSGLHQDIEKSLGAPFNRTAQSTGHGLGLAWVKTICDIYEWKLSFIKNPSNHIVRIDFDN